MPVVGAATFWMSARAPVEPLRFRRAPLLAAAVALAAGELLARHAPSTALLTAATALLALLTLVALRYSLRLSLLPLLALWAVAGCWCVQLQPWPPRQTALLASADGLSRMVEGRVVRVRRLPAPPSAATPEAQPWKLEPGEWASEGTAATEAIDLDVRQVEYLTPDIAAMRPVTGGVRVTVLDGAPAFACGDLLRLPLRLREPERYRDPGAWSYADNLLRDGIAAQANVKAARVERLGASPPSLHCRLYAAQAWAAARISTLAGSRANRSLPTVARLTPEDAAMLNAMLFGDRSGLTHQLRLGFERTGSFHLFVVSGMHVALLAGLLFWALRRLRVATRPGHAPHHRAHGSLRRADRLRRSGAARPADGQRLPARALAVAKRHHPAGHRRRRAGGPHRRPQGAG